MSKSVQNSQQECTRLLKINTTGHTAEWSPRFETVTNLLNVFNYDRY